MASGPAPSSPSPPSSPDCPPPSLAARVQRRASATASFLALAATIKDLRRGAASPVKLSKQRRREIRAKVKRRASRSAAKAQTRPEARVGASEKRRIDAGEAAASSGAAGPALGGQPRPSKKARPTLTAAGPSAPDSPPRVPRRNPWTLSRRAAVLGSGTRADRGDAP